LSNEEKSFELTRIGEISKECASNKPPEVLKQIENESSVSFGVAEKKPLINIYLSGVYEIVWL